jgi:hypothetical protein
MRIPPMDPLRYKQLEFTGTASSGLKLWLHFDDIQIKGARHFETEEITIDSLSETSVSIGFHFHLDKLVIEGNTVKGRLINYIEFEKHGTYSAKMFDVEVKGKAHYIFMENGNMRLDSLKTKVAADDIVVCYVHHFLDN